MSLTPFEVATWLFNPNGFGATDEEFAETFVLAYKIWKEGYGVDGRLTVEDMYKYDTQEIADCLQPSVVHQRRSLLSISCMRVQMSPQIPRRSHQIRLD